VRTTLDAWAAEVIAILRDAPRQAAIRARMLQCVRPAAAPACSAALAARRI
jgi:hypothetical protein